MTERTSPQMCCPNVIRNEMRDHYSTNSQEGLGVLSIPELGLTNSEVTVECPMNSSFWCTDGAVHVSTLAEESSHFLNFPPVDVYMRNTHITHEHEKYASVRKSINISFNQSINPTIRSTAEQGLASWRKSFVPTSQHVMFSYFAVALILIPQVVMVQSWSDPHDARTRNGYKIQPLAEKELRKQKKYNVQEQK